MSAVVQLGSRYSADHLLAFVREQGAVTVSEVMSRYGWDRREARRHLDELRDTGRLIARMAPRSWTGGGGNSIEWVCAA